MRSFTPRAAGVLILGSTTITLLMLAGAGCAPQEAKTSENTAAAPVLSNTVSQTPGAAPAGAPSVMAGPMSGMMGGDPTAPLSKTPELDKNIAAAEKKGDKKAIADAHAKRGTFRMEDDKAGARVKYRAALDDYRAALKADPANAEAGKNKKTIEDVYRSMGRPVPGDEKPVVK